MRRQAAPSDSAGQTKLIEPFGVIVSDAAAEHLALPCIGWNLESLQLAEHFEGGALALHLRAWCDMLPAQEPAHELRRVDRLYLLAKGGNRKTVNASKQAAIAPFGLVCHRVGKLAAQD